MFSTILIFTSSIHEQTYIWALKPRLRSALTLSAAEGLIYIERFTTCIKYTIKAALRCTRIAGLVSPFFGQRSDRRCKIISTPTMRGITVSNDGDRLARANRKRVASRDGTFLALYSMRSRHVPGKFKMSKITATAARITPPLHHSTA